MPYPLDIAWVEHELIPFLNIVFNPGTGHAQKNWNHWKSDIKHAAGNISAIQNYNDSAISIDLIRLTLLEKPPLMDKKDRLQANKVIRDAGLVITIFVRHAMTHGPYGIMSLGMCESREASQWRAVLKKAGVRLPEMISKSATSSRSRGARSRNKHFTEPWRTLSDRNPRSFGQNLMPVYSSNVPVNGYSADPNIPPFSSTFSSDAYSYPSAGYYEPSQSRIDYNAINFDYPHPFTPVWDDSVWEKRYEISQPTPYGHVPVGYNNGFQDLVGYAGNGSPHTITQGNPTAENPVFVPEKPVYNSRYAPKFVPGRREHVTLSMAGDKVAQL